MEKKTAMERIREARELREKKNTPIEINKTNKENKK